MTIVIILLGIALVLAVVAFAQPTYRTRLLAGAVVLAIIALILGLSGVSID